MSTREPAGPCQGSASLFLFFSFLGGGGGREEGGLLGLTHSVRGFELSTTKIYEGQQWLNSISTTSYAQTDIK